MDRTRPVYADACDANLGCATTAHLLFELAARARTDGAHHAGRHFEVLAALLSDDLLRYTTVGGPAGDSRGDALLPPAWHSPPPFKNGVWSTDGAGRGSVHW